MRSKQEFLREWVNSISEDSGDRSWARSNDHKKFSGVPTLYAFVDMDYFVVLSPVSWTPASYKNSQVNITRGFITDFASVPRLFWSLVPPTGRYGFAALFHDYAYWQQTMNRTDADELFSDTMIELEVSSWTRRLLYYSVRIFGFVAWRNNAAAKSTGDKRVLKEFPTDIKTAWSEWKKKPGVFL